MRTNRRVKIVATACALMAGLCAAATAKIIYVDGDAQESGNGSSWANAHKYLQTALTAASAGDEIRVAQGLYRPDQGLPPRTTRVARRTSAIEVAAVGSPLEVFQLKNGVALLGGFAGLGAVDPNARDTEKYETVLSGDLRSNDVDSWGSGSSVFEFVRSDNSLSVIQCMSTDATAVLDGFVVESAVQSIFFNHGGSPRIANCVFQKGFDVALRCDGGQPTLVNCVFQENGSATSMGGAIIATNARLTLKSCRFLGNSAAHEGGAIYGASSDLTLTACTFEMNAASAGGAIHHTAGTLTLVDCTFEGNAAQEGGAVAFAVERASMTRCVFKKNWALTMGGALENGGAPLTLDQCTFLGNTAGTGGALYAARLTASKTAPGFVTTMTRCIFAGNYASGMGGALYRDQMELTILNCTFTGNRAGASATLAWPDTGASATIYPISLENCIVWDGGQSIAPFVSPSRAPRSGTSHTTTAQNVVVRYSDVQGGWMGEGVINIDPGFAAGGYWVDADNPAAPVTSDYSNALWIEGDYHLKSKAGRWDPMRMDWVLDAVASPCIDAGDPNSLVADEPQPNGGRINMGAYGGTAEASKSYQVPETPAPPVIRR
jgi:predicted outer membrane repeat protein